MQCIVCLQDRSLDFQALCALYAVTGMHYITITLFYHLIAWSQK